MVKLKDTQNIEVKMNLQTQEIGLALICLYVIAKIKLLKTFCFVNTNILTTS